MRRPTINLYWKRQRYKSCVHKFKDLKRYLDMIMRFNGPAVISMYYPMFKYRLRNLEYLKELIEEYRPSYHIATHSDKMRLKYYRNQV